jgi:mRNA interferase RelE/StbE
VNTQKAGQRAYVRLTDPAVADLLALLKKDPQIVRWALKKMLLLERNPQAGEPLLGHLIGWRKLTVGDRDWRIVWRISTDETGAITITISEVWAVGARSEAEVYTEMAERVTNLGSHPAARPLLSVIDMLGRHVQRHDIAAAIEPETDPVPDWLQQRLVKAVGMTTDEILSMSGAEAMIRWEQFLQEGT